MTEAHAEPWPHPQGPWTVDDWMTLPHDGKRYEIIDGSLLVSPVPVVRHQVIAGGLVGMLRAASPEHLGVVEAVGLRLGPERLLIPDVVVASAEVLVSEAATLAPDDVALVIEVVSPSSVAMDNVMKPHLYAKAGIPAMWRVALRPAGAEVTVLRLKDSSYVEEAVVGSGTLRAEWPFAVEIDVERLLVPR
jgi:Uma2 family endonuclease